MLLRTVYPTCPTATAKVSAMSTTATATSAYVSSPVLDAATAAVVVATAAAASTALLAAAPASAAALGAAVAAAVVAAAVVAAAVVALVVVAALVVAGGVAGGVARGVARGVALPLYTGTTLDALMVVAAKSNQTGGGCVRRHATVWVERKGERGREKYRRSAAHSEAGETNASTPRETRAALPPPRDPPK